MINERQTLLSKVPPASNEVWRRRRDSNPRDPFESNGFQDRRIQPLCHSSAMILLHLWKPALHILLHICP